MLRKRIRWSGPCGGDSLRGTQCPGADSCRDLRAQVILGVSSLDGDDGKGDGLRTRGL